MNKWHVTVIKQGNIVKREEFDFKRQAHAFMFQQGKPKYICKVQKSYVFHVMS
jgi:hypothetical protein